MRILLIGEKNFAQKIKNSLNKYCKTKNISNFEIKFADTYKNLKGILSFIPNLIKSDILLSIKGYIKRKNEIELAFLFKKKIIFFWIGTDVLSAIEAFKNKKYCPKYIKNVIHFCECDWIKKELEEIGINPSILPFVSIDVDKLIKNQAYIEKKIIEKYQYENNKKFIIFTYINRHRPYFYGLDKIFILGNILKNKNCEIRVAGIEKNEINERNIEPTPNITFLGYINNMDDEYLNSHLFLRLTEHDGLSISVLEALSYACHVFYTYEFPFTIKAESINDLCQKTEAIYNKFINNELKANLEGKEYIINNYSESIINKKIFEFLTSDKI